MRITWIRAAAIAVTLASAAMAESPIPGRLDSLQARTELRLSLPAGGNNKLTQPVIRAGLNEALVSVCTDFNACSKFDTLVARSDSEGVGLPADFMRAERVFRMLAPSNGNGLDVEVRYPVQLVPAGDSGAILGATVTDYQLKTDNRLGPTRAYVSAARRLSFLPHYDRQQSADTALYLLEYYGLAPRMDSPSDTAAVDPKYRGALLDKACEILAGIRETWSVQAHYLQEYERKVGLYGIREPIAAEKERQ